jgi:hypothetical protein
MCEAWSSPSARVTGKRQGASRAMALRTVSLVRRLCAADARRTAYARMIAPLECDAGVEMPASTLRPTCSSTASGSGFATRDTRFTHVTKPTCPSPHGGAACPTFPSRPPPQQARKPPSGSVGIQLGWVPVRYCNRRRRRNAIIGSTLVPSTIAGAGACQLAEAVGGPRAPRSAQDHVRRRRNDPTCSADDAQPQQECEQSQTLGAQVLACDQHAHDRDPSPSRSRPTMLMPAAFSVGSRAAIGTDVVFHPVSRFSWLRSHARGEASELTVPLCAAATLVVVRDHVVEVVRVGS